LNYKNNISSETPNKGFQWLLIIFLFLEYVRPEGIAQLRLQSVIIVIMAVAFIFSNNRPKSAIITAQLVFFLVIAKSLPFATNNYAVYQILITMFGYLSISCAFAWLMSTKRSFHLIIWIWVIVTTYCAAYGMTHGGRGPGGYTGDENDLALACIVALPVTLFGFDYFQGWKRWGSLSIGVILSAGIIASFSRGGFIGFAFVVLHYFFLSGKKLQKVTMFVIFLGAFFMLSPPEYIDEIKSIQTDSSIESGSDSTGLQRFYLWATATNMFLSNPIMGVGAGNFDYLAGIYQPTEGDWPPSFFDRSWSGTTIHSAYFQLLSELAIPGVIVFIYLLWKCYQTIKLIRHDIISDTEIPGDVKNYAVYYSAALTGGIIGYLSSGAFLSVIYYPHLWFLSAMIIALDASTKREIIMNSE